MTAPDEDNGWTPEALAVLKRAGEHYGGAKTWRALRLIRLFPERLSGLLPRLKGAGVTFLLPRVVEVEPHARRTRFLDYPEPGFVGVFENGGVRIETLDGAVRESNPDHRKTFRGLRKNRRWAPLDALYFFGYALWHYHSLPFSLADARLLSVRRARSNEEWWDALEVELPADVPTHSRHQTFYVDQTGRIRRHDYCAEVIGVWARGAHFWNHEERINGFPVAMERHVVPRLGSVILPGTALHATFRGIEVQRATPATT